MGLNIVDINVFYSTFTNVFVTFLRFIAFFISVSQTASATVINTVIA